MAATNSLKDALRASAVAEPGPSGRPPRSGSGGSVAKLVGGRFPEPVHRQLRVLSAQQGRTLQDMLAEALNDLFQKHKLPPIA